MIVLKFGGSSVAEPSRIKHIGALIKARLDQQEELSIVFSAFGGVTDSLIDMAQTASKGSSDYKQIHNDFVKRHNDALAELVQGPALSAAQEKLQHNHDTLEQLLSGVYLVREASLRTMDYILSFGERNSCFIIAEYFKSIGLNAAFLDAREIIKTDKTFGAAQVDFPITNESCKQFFTQNPGKTHVVTGFIASDVGGLTTTLGRGGSDFTAAILAGALDAEKLEIWTDVDGVLTCDPRKVSKAYTVESLSYNEAMELSHFGAKVIYPPTIQPALAKQIPIYIRNTFNPDFPGTKISKESDESKARIKGMSSMSGVCLLTLQGPGMMGIPGIAARFFGSLARKKINVVMITQGSSEHSICVAIKQAKKDEAIAAVEDEFKSEIEQSFIQTVGVLDDVNIIAIVGQNMRKIPGVAGRLFGALGKEGVNVVAIAQGSSELNISFAINAADERKALNLIHDSFFLSNLKTVNVFMVGVGLIGGTLLKQISEQEESLQKTQKLQINVVGLANSKKMLFEENGIDLSKWKDHLDNSQNQSSVAGFVENMKQMNLPNSVFVDNTANKSLPDIYRDVLNHNISICTPNKVANSSSYAQYSSLSAIARHKNVDFLYETNVGAGLPVISTLRTLIESGDEIVKIEAVLSGSVSYIFNNWTAERAFKDLVMEAKELGYTEPDPRDDLSGLDIKRKILILSREAGYAVEPDDVQVEPILPQSSIDAPTVEAFIDTLSTENDHFKTLIDKADEEQKAIRYIASFEAGQAAVKLQFVDQDNPFYSLKGSDNMIVFTTRRYANRPLVVRGPGAGAEVTAAGVFSEIISIGNKNHYGFN